MISSDERVTAIHYIALFHNKCNITSITEVMGAFRKNRL
jgi:hypothetical protein